MNISALVHTECTQKNKTPDYLKGFIVRKAGLEPARP